MFLRLLYLRCFSVFEQLCGGLQTYLAAPRRPGGVSGCLSHRLLGSSGSAPGGGGEGFWVLRGLSEGNRKRSGAGSVFREGFLERFEIIKKRLVFPIFFIRGRGTALVFPRAAAGVDLGGCSGSRAARPELFERSRGVAGAFPAGTSGILAP